MRNLTAVLLLVLFCSMQLTSCAPAIEAPDCCVKMRNVKIPLKRVVSYSWTSSSCPLKAIVFVMIGGKEICVDPKHTWISGHVAQVDRRTAAMWLDS